MPVHPAMSALTRDPEFLRDMSNRTPLPDHPLDEHQMTVQIQPTVPDRRFPNGRDETSPAPGGLRYGRLHLSSMVSIATERAEGLLVEFLHTLPTVRLYCVLPKISARARERYRLSASKSEIVAALAAAVTLTLTPMAPPG
jgi:hypothetical protein